METTLQQVLSIEANLAAHPQTSEILKQRAELLLTASELLSEAMAQKGKCSTDITVMKTEAYQ